MSVVYTVGYEGTDIERFVATLKAAGITQLADVRAVALSRKKGFSKTKFSERLMAEGIEYLHVIGLGDPKPGREAARAGRYEEFEKIYREHLRASVAERDMKILQSYVRKGPTALLCFERDPVTCHRTIIAEKLASDLGVEVFNLYADEPQKYVRNADKMPTFNYDIAAE